jgi:hypothetical protein
MIKRGGVVLPATGYRGCTGREFMSLFVAAGRAL